MERVEYSNEEGDANNAEDGHRQEEYCDPCLEKEAVVCGADTSGLRFERVAVIVCTGVHFHIQLLPVCDTQTQVSTHCGRVVDKFERRHKFEVFGV